MTLDLENVLSTAAKNIKSASNETCLAVFDFMMDRMKGYYLDLGFSPQVFEAVLATRPTSPLDFDSRIKSIAEFEKSDAAESLSAANKRINNILKKSGESPSIAINTELFEHQAEHELYESFFSLEKDLQTHEKTKSYNATLTLLSNLKEPIDKYFDTVMVMVDNPKIKANRLALLSSIIKEFGKIADISKLSV